MDSHLLAKYDRLVPRYTSYPTAPHFSAAVGADDYRDWLAAIAVDEPLSLYVHVPFCDSLCWFCGCHTKIVRRYQPVADYLEVLKREIALVTRALGGRRPLGHLHFGGGSPTIMAPMDLFDLTDWLGSHFAFAPETELAVEIDPREVRREMVEAWARAGATRASLGVLDFNPEVQRAINRIQSFDQTAQVIDWLRTAGVGRINIDLMYGLPYQSLEGAVATAEQVIELRPDRVALFGYAHVPWMKRHQRLIEEAALPDSRVRFDQSQAVAERLAQAGYLRIGLDHFARPEDPLARAQARGELQRNFQGYTADPCNTLIGLGASAIGAFREGYLQNAAPLKDYGEAIRAGRLATVRGIRVDPDDRLRGQVIERLMCDLVVDLDALGCGEAGSAFETARAALRDMERDGLVTLDGSVVRMTEAGRPLVRSVCALFDRYLSAGQARHSSAV